MSVLLSMTKVLDDVEEVSRGKGSMSKHEAHFLGDDLSICSFFQELIDRGWRDAKPVARVVVVLDRREKELVMGLPVILTDRGCQISLDLPDGGTLENPLTFSFY